MSIAQNPKVLRKIRRYDAFQQQSLAASHPIDDQIIDFLAETKTAPSKTRF